MISNEDFPDNFWDYGLNPILGHRYQKDNNSMNSRIKAKIKESLKNEGTNSL